MRNVGQQANAASQPGTAAAGAATGWQVWRLGSAREGGARTLSSFLASTTTARTSAAIASASASFWNLPAASGGREGARTRRARGTQQAPHVTTEAQSRRQHRRAAGHRAQHTHAASSAPRPPCPPPSRSAAGLPPHFVAPTWRSVVVLQHGVDEHPVRKMSRTHGQVRAPCRVCAYSEQRDCGGRGARRARRGRSPAPPHRR